MIGHAPYIHYIYVNISQPRPQMVLGVYSRPGVYLLQSLAYPRRINKTSVYSKEAFIRGYTVYVRMRVKGYPDCNVGMKEMGSEDDSSRIRL